MDSRLRPTRISRRSALVTLSGVAAGAFLAACAPTASPANTPAAAPAAASAATATTAAAPASSGATLAPTPTTQPGVQGLPTPASGQSVITYWHNFGVGVGADAHLKQINAFLKANPKYAVDAQFVPTTAGTQLSDKLVAAISGGDPPAAARFDRFIVTSWAARGFLTELTDQAKRDGVTQDKFITEGWLEATWKGKVFAVPFDTDLRGLYYNKKQFTDAGLDPAKPPTTIDELDAMADKLVKKTGSKITQMGFIPWVQQGSLYTYGWIFGGEFYDRSKDVITLDHPQIIKALEWMVSYAKKYNVDTIDQYSQAFGNNEQIPFVSGLTSMVSDGDWEVSTFIKYMKPDMKDQWDVVPYPKAPGGPDQVTWGGGWATVVPKGAKDPDGGWALAKYLGTDSASTYSIDTTHIPVYLPVYDDLTKNKDKFDPRWTKFWPLRSVARFRPNLPVGQELWNAQTEAADLARHGKEEPAAVLQRLSKSVNDQYAKYKG
jgi:multiple sugar transport system substrate-binding protein